MFFLFVHFIHTLLVMMVYGLISYFTLFKRNLKMTLLSSFLLGFILMGMKIAVRLFFTL